jgi:hypothetical protein
MSLEVAIQSLADAIRLLANTHPATRPTAHPELTIEHSEPKPTYVDEDITETVVVVDAITPTEKPKRRKKTAETKPEVTEPEVTEAPASLFDDLDLGLDEDEPEVEVTADVLKKTLSDLGQEKGRELVLAIFKELKVKSFKDIAEEDFGKAYKLARAHEA